MPIVSMNWANYKKNNLDKANNCSVLIRDLVEKFKVSNSEWVGINYEGSILFFNNFEILQNIFPISLRYPGMRQSWKFQMTHVLHLNGFLLSWINTLCLFKVQSWMPFHLHEQMPFVYLWNILIEDRLFWLAATIFEGFSL